jgi:DNA helicase HerA-like ATPase
MTQVLNNDNEITYFGQTNYRNQQVKFGIKLDDRRRHIYVIGKTGVGKTVLLKNLAVQDMQNGHGMCYIDPNGDAVEELLGCIPSYRLNDVVYFNPADLNNPIAFNILESVSAEYHHLVADGLMGVFTKIWANSWSSRMEHILRNCILALLEVPGNTLLGIIRILVDKEFRRNIVSRVTNPMVKSFWVDEFANWNDKFRTEAIQPIQNKVGQFLSSSIIRNILGQPKSTIDPRKIMDEGRILLMNMSKGKIGEDNSALLGAMMITKIQMLFLVMWVP